MALLIICEILGHFVNTLTTNGKYSLPNSEILLQSIQMKLYKERINCFEIFALFLRSISNFEHFESKNDPHSLGISENKDCERRS